MSRGLDPVFMIPISLLLAIAFAAHEGLRWRFVGLLLFVDVLVPTVFFLTMLYHRQITSWDIRKREERIPLYAFALICHMGGIWLAYVVGKTHLASVLLLYYASGIVFFLITLRWKISIHAGVNAVLITSLNMFYQWRYWYLYGLVLAVMWARVYQKHHTWSQVMLGALLGVGMMIGGLGMLTG